MGFWTSTALAFALCAFAPVWQQDSSPTDSPHANLPGERTAVVFHVKGATFPGRPPTFSLEGEDGVSFVAKLGRPWDLHRIKPSEPEWMREVGENDGWTEGVFWDIPVGTYTFVARSTPFHPLLRIENVKVTHWKGYGCYPAELQELVLQEKDSITVGFQSALGKRVSTKHWPDEMVRIVQVTDDGVQLRPNRILEIDQIRFSKEYATKGFWLILSGHAPIPLHGLNDGDILPMERTAFVEFDLKPTGNWPDGWYVFLYLLPVSDQPTLAFHQLQAGCRSVDGMGDGKVFFPEDGDYRVGWRLMPDRFSIEAQDACYESIGGTISLKARDPAQKVVLEMPAEFLEAAWKAGEWRSNAEIPVLEMTAEPPPLEVPPPPPAKSPLPSIDHH